MFLGAAVGKIKTRPAAETVAARKVELPHPSLARPWAKEMPTHAAEVLRLGKQSDPLPLHVTTTVRVKEVQVKAIGSVSGLYAVGEGARSSAYPAIDSASFMIQQSRAVQGIDVHHQALFHRQSSAVRTPPATAKTAHFTTSRIFLNRVQSIA
jgi:hypothetical protein